MADALGFLDLLAVEYNRSIDNPGPQHFSDGLSVRGSVPYGYWTLFGEYDYSDYHYDVQGLSAKFALMGHTDRLTGGLNRVLGRTQASKTSLEAGYEIKHQASYLEDVQLFTQSQDLAALSLRLTYSVNFDGDVWYSTVGLKRGLAGLGTDLKGQPAPTPSSPHAVYWKPSYDLNGYHPFSLNGMALGWNPALHYEYADRTLYGSEQLNVGGPFTVRGFHDNSLIGEHGGYLRNDLVMPMPGDVLPDRAKGEFYLGLDAGWAHAAVGTTTGAGAVAGGAFGWRGQLGPVSVDASGTHAFVNAPLPHEGWILELSATAGF